ncbi:MAG: hypothetical protein IKE65_03170 [Clostridia bacterium]|nr:hypothetical protein [Clostridia bacterium]
MKKLISILLIFTLICGAFSCLCVSVSAQESYVPVHQCEQELEELGVDVELLHDTLAAGIERFESDVDISDLNIPMDGQLYNLLLLMAYVRYYMPEYFHITDISAMASSTKFYYLCFSYDERFDTAEEYNAAKAQIDAVVENMCEDLTSKPAIDKVQGALLMHDRLIAHTSYDMNVFEAGAEISDDSYTLYGALINRVCVCEGYSKAYLYLLKRLGIPSLIVSSEALEHAWNIVFLDGVPYYVDCTWDDPAGDYAGTCMHDNFLRSTEGIVSTGHVSDTGEVDYLPSFDIEDTTYDAYYWQDSACEMQLIEDNLYYLDNEAAAIKRAPSGEVVCSCADTWRIGPRQYYVYNFSKLDAIGNALFFSKSDGVYRCDVNTGKVKKIFTPDASEFGTYYSVFGFCCEGRTFMCYMSNNANCDYTTIDNYLKTHEYAHYEVNLSYDTAQGSATIAGETDELCDVLLCAVPQPGYTFSGFYAGSELITDEDTDQNPNTVEYEVRGDAYISVLFKPEPATGAIFGAVKTSNLYKTPKAELFRDGVCVDTIAIQRNGNGGFVFMGLMTGTYTMRISGAGFAGVVIKDISVKSGQRTDLRLSEDENLKALVLPAGDINGDEWIDVADASEILSAEKYGKSYPSTVPEDLNANKVIDMEDIAVLLLEQNYAHGIQVFYCNDNAA